jgi:hypothetical protein
VTNPNAFSTAVHDLDVGMDPVRPSVWLPISSARRAIGFSTLRRSARRASSVSHRACTAGRSPPRVSERKSPQQLGSGPGAVRTARCTARGNARTPTSHEVAAHRRREVGEVLLAVAGEVHPAVVQQVGHDGVAGARSPTRRCSARRTARCQLLLHPLVGQGSLVRGMRQYSRRVSRPARHPQRTASCGSADSGPAHRTVPADRQRARPAGGRRGRCSGACTPARVLTQGDEDVGAERGSRERGRPTHGVGPGVGRTRRAGRAVRGSRTSCARRG